MTVIELDAVSTVLYSTIVECDIHTDLIKRCILEWNSAENSYDTGLFLFINITQT